MTKIKLNEIQKKMLDENKIDTLLFYIGDNNTNIDLTNYAFEYNEEIYKVIHFDIINLHELHRYMDPSSVYMNRFNGYGYETLVGANIRSSHHLRKFLLTYFPTNYDFNSNKKDMLIIKLNNLDFKNLN